MQDPPIAAILAGGLARRMGGGDKCLLTVAGRPILAHIVERLAPQSPRLILNANGDPARFKRFGLSVVPDDLPGHPGPLAGLLAVLDHVAAHHAGADLILTVPGDTPFLPSDLVERLGSARAHSAIACAASGGRQHPTVALWPLALREDLRAALAEGERAIGRFAARHPVSVVEWPGTPDPFLNVNDADDLAQAESRIASR